MHVIATAGHVDHGKSTLVKALTGVDPDRFDEEKERGLTIDLGFGVTQLPSGNSVSLIDVPGHIRFIKNMLAGVGSLKACIFVVAATEGWKPQSEEHLRILELLGVKHGIVALTKVNLCDEDLVELAHIEVEDHIADTFLEGVPVIHIDALDGLGVNELRDALDDLIKTLPISEDLNRPRLWIDRVFAAKGAGTVVTGTLTGGSLKVDDDLELLPHHQQVRIRSLQNHHEECFDLPPGSRCALNLSGVSHDELARGDVLVRNGQWHETTIFDASLHVLEQLDHSVSRKGAYVLYLGSGEHSVRMRVLGSNELIPGSDGTVRLYASTGLPLLPGDRFILRESGRSETIGGGEVLDVDPQLTASEAEPDLSVERVIKERSWVEATELERLTGKKLPSDVGKWVVEPSVLRGTLERIREEVTLSGPLGLDLSQLDERDRAAAELLEDLKSSGGRLLAADSLDSLSDHPFVKKLNELLFAPPDPEGVDRAELRELVRRGDVIEQDGIFFSPSALEEAGRLAAELLKKNPEGFAVSTFRESAGNTRKHALPLLGYLDSTGVTRRRGDVRIAGPRLPSI
ncbi:MAG: selenocysteine-specific translation elongation factor [Acidimicrobiales bacterium]|nr:selenocysteine-specific translation elongation factor [Acidimicrobiales bacterium]